MSPCKILTLLICMLSVTLGMEYDKRAIEPAPSKSDPKVETTEQTGIYSDLELNVTTIKELSEKHKMKGAGACANEIVMMAQSNAEFYKLILTCLNNPHASCDYMTNFLFGPELFSRSSGSAEDKVFYQKFENLVPGFRGPLIMSFTINMMTWETIALLAAKKDWITLANTIASFCNNFTLVKFTCDNELLKVFQKPATQASVLGFSWGDFTSQATKQQILGYMDSFKVDFLRDGFVSHFLGREIDELSYNLLPLCWNFLSNNFKADMQRYPTKVRWLGQSQEIFAQKDSLYGRIVVSVLGLSYWLPANQNVTMKFQQYPNLSAIAERVGQYLYLNNFTIEWYKEQGLLSRGAIKERFPMSLQDDNTMQFPEVGKRDLNCLNFLRQIEASIGNPSYLEFTFKSGYRPARLNLPKVGIGPSTVDLFNSEIKRLSAEIAAEKITSPKKQHAQKESQSKLPLKENKKKEEPARPAPMPKPSGEEQKQASLDSDPTMAKPEIKDQTFVQPTPSETHHMEEAKELAPSAPQLKEEKDTTPPEKSPEAQAGAPKPSSLSKVLSRAAQQSKTQLPFKIVIESPIAGRKAHALGIKLDITTLLAAEDLNLLRDIFFYPDTLESNYRWQSFDNFITHLKGTIKINGGTARMTFPWLENNNTFNVHPPHKANGKLYNFGFADFAASGLSKVFGIEKL